MRRANVGRPDYEVDPETGCWNWLKQKTYNGYGRKWGGTAGGKGMVAHRWYWENVNGPMPDGLEIDHLCRNKACVNPAHLEAVTRTENRHRRAPFTAEQVRHVRAVGMRPFEAAAYLGISTTAAGWITRGMTWKDV